MLDDEPTVFEKTEGEGQDGEIEKIAFSMLDKNDDDAINESTVFEKIDDNRDDGEIEKKKSVGAVLEKKVHFAQPILPKRERKKRSMFETRTF